MICTHNKKKQIQRKYFTALKSRVTQVTSILWKEKKTMKTKNKEGWQKLTLVTLVTRWLNVQVTAITGWSGKDVSYSMTKAHKNTWPCESLDFLYIGDHIYCILYILLDFFSTHTHLKSFLWEEQEGQTRRGRVNDASPYASLSSLVSVSLPHSTRESHWQCRQDM